MAKIKKSCLILLVLLILLILSTAFVFSLWQTDRPLMNLSKFSSEELYKYAEQKVKYGDFKEAQKYINVALEKEAGNVSYLGESAIIKYHLGDYQGAIAEYQKILDQGNYLGFALNGIANIYRDIAEKTADRGPAFAKTSAGKQKTEYRNKAIKTYQEGITKDPKYPALYSNYAILLIANKKFDEAKDILEKGIAATGAPELKALLKTINQ